VLYFAPPEIDLLFPAPFTRRQLLLYKLAGFVTAALLLGAASAFGVAPLVRSWLAAWLGLSLAFLFLNGLTLCGELLALIAASQHFTRGRKLAAAGVGALLLAGLAETWWRMQGRSWFELAEQLPRSGAGRVLLAPLRVFAQIAAAEAPGEGVGWVALALAMVLGTYAAAIALDANYLEASAAVSRRVQERFKRIATGGSRRRGRTRRASGLAALPFWGGLGSIAALQLTLLKRSTRAMLTLLLLACGLSLVLALAARSREATEVPRLTIGILVYTTFLVSMHLPMAFRGDLRQIELLKSLPVCPLSVVGGQILVAAGALSALHGCILAVVAVLFHGGARLLWASAACSLPFNALIVGVETWLFLALPSSAPLGGSAGASQAGRLLMMTSVKLLTAAVVLGVAAGLGGSVLLLGGGVGAALCAGIAVLYAASALIALLVAWRFRRLDVSLDVID
jgi:hypothetical protein